MSRKRIVNRQSGKRTIKPQSSTAHTAAEPTENLEKLPIVSDTALYVLWDKWKTQNDLFYSRYTAFWILEIAIFGWLLNFISGGTDFRETMVMIILLVLMTLVGLYIRHLMEIDLIVRNTYNLQIVLALSERGVYEEPDNFAELRGKWSPKSFDDKINNWHCIAAQDWKLESGSRIKRGTLSTMNVIVLMCILHVILILGLITLALS
jgi:hypothetical protein